MPRYILRLPLYVIAGAAAGLLIPKYFGVRVFLVVTAVYVVYSVVQISRSALRARRSLRELERAINDLKTWREWDAYHSERPH